MTQANRTIVDDIELQARQKQYGNWKWRELSEEDKHGHLIRIAIDVHAEISGECLANGFTAFSTAGTKQCLDGDCSGTHFDLLCRPTFQEANGQLICFILAKSSEASLCDFGYSKELQRNLDLIWEF